MLLTDLGWVAVVDGDRFVGGLTPESVFESLRRSMDIRMPSSEPGSSAPTTL